jgi:DNA-directed RNA polymerase specialized sigma24 family protein
MTAPRSVQVAPGPSAACARPAAATAGPDVATLVERLAPRVYRIARALTGSDRVAELVLHDVMGSTLRQPRHAEDPMRPPVAVYRLAVSAALARRGTWPGAGGTWPTYLPRFTADGHRVAEGPDDWSGRTDAELLAVAEEALRDAVATLPGELAAVLVLADAERLLCAEIAEILGEPEDVVRSRAHQARMVLRAMVSRALARAPSA